MLRVIVLGEFTVGAVWSSVEQCGIYGWIGIGWWLVDRVVSIIYIEGPRNIYRGIYNRVL